MSRQAYIEIDLAALKHNIQQLKRIAAPAKVMAVVKGNGYGLGLDNLAPALQCADALSVRCLEEGIRLRALSLSQPIILLEGIFSQKELEACVQYKMTPVIHSHRQLDWVLNHTQALQIWLKVNLGMNRLGFELEEIPALYEQCKATNHVDCLGIMGHCPTASEVIDARTEMMGQKIHALAEQLSCQYSLSNSAVSLRYPDYHGNWIRAGIALYGISPFDIMDEKYCHSLKTVVTLKSELMHIKAVKPNQPVGYGGTWVTPKSGATLGVVSIGYADGYPRVPTGTPVKINDQMVKTVGRVNMDMLLVDLSEVAHRVKVGDLVVLWGEALDIKIIAKAANSSAHELLARLPAALSRRTV